MNNKDFKWLLAFPLVLWGFYVFLTGNIIPVSFVSQPLANEVQESIAPLPFVQQKVFGNSVTGRPIDGYEIGTGSEVLLFLGSIHGNEMGTTDLLNRFVSEIQANPKLLADNKKLVVIPIVNPDGYYDRVDKLNANEVNLNINFDTTGWQRYGPSGTSAGEQPFSEPESRVIREVVEKYQPTAMFAYHAQGSLVSPEFYPKSIVLAQWYANNTGYAYYDEWDYAGTATKWFIEKTGYPAITIELKEYLKSDWLINKPALLKIISSDEII